MIVMALNCGSSSLKYKLISLPDKRELAGGEAQRVGPKTAEPARIIHHVKGTQKTHFVEMNNHGEAFREVMNLLSESPELIPDCLGHRMVHGGSLFRKPVIVNEDVVASLEKINHLAPIHNPPALDLVKACHEMYPDLPSCVVFDTAFHSTIPQYAYTYALPEELRNSMGIRKYGFHGTSHQFVAEEAARILDIPMGQFNAVSCHLGSGGASLAAIVNGRSVDNTMGYSPLQGLLMSTRSGDLDPAIVLLMVAQKNGDFDSVESQLNKKSGVLGLSGVSPDIRDIFALKNKKQGAVESLNHAASLYVWRVKKYLGAYLATVGKADAVIFTDTIGETMPVIRWMICADMDVFGIKIDPEKNNSQELPLVCSRDDSPVRILAIQTNEELAIAIRTYELLDKAA
ncbi:acetate/propionate family kinase [Candidatus Sumerlaeota bacterium]|nr:acetate/propionate family kinase [Candidatus Sumerlaeota bacterium]